MSDSPFARFLEVQRRLNAGTGVCPACNTTVTVDARGGLLPHHPGVNAGTPHGGAALCFPGLPERACERTFVHVAHDWHAATGSFRCKGLKITSLEGREDNG